MSETLHVYKYLITLLEQSLGHTNSNSSERNLFEIIATGRSKLLLTV